MKAFVFVNDNGAAFSRYKKNEIVKRMGIIPSFFDTIFLQSQSIRKDGL